MKSLKLLHKQAAKISIFLLAGVAANTISCNRDLLDKKPLDKLTDDAVFSDATFLQNYVYGVYNGMKPIWYPGTGGFETLTDVAVSQPETHDKAAGIRQYIEGTISPDNITDLTGIWNEEYGYIRKANVFFEKTSASSIDAAKLDPMKGEMHFLRAWMYFELTKTFGGVPIVTKSYKLDDANFDVPRNTYDECAKFILDECEQAITLLKDVAPAGGKITKAAAMALKARVLLYMASPLNNPSNDKTKWQAAEAATKAVLDLSFTLHPTHDDLFTRPLKMDEIILGKSFTPGTRVPDWGFNYDYWPSGFDARQRIMPTQTFVNMFQMTNGQYPYLPDGVTVNPASGYDPQQPNKNRDPRYYSDIIYPGAGPFTINDGAKSTLRTYEYWEDANPNPDNAAPYTNPHKVDPKNGQNLYDFGRDSKTYWVKGLTPFHWRVQTGYTFRRLCDFTGPRASFDYDYTQAIVFLRLAEFYLNYAEIQMALGNEAVARDYINKVRKRPSVNMPDITSTGAALVKEYRNERAIELHLEDHRFFDLMRWKAAPGNIDIPIRGLTSVKMDWTGTQPSDLLGKLSYAYGVIEAAEVRKPWKGDYYYLLPIPREEIKKSHDAIKQNPGFE
ncbi:RagB/SusD family nutrient uptake outer membrane protein [Chitinophaga sp. 22321]|uniref:RagB/SusD family nutrient uptake outer membrane protein n=1 Tax=Chitinophaga hostae TaxID=2831022 RepID=A0ABS5IYI1_9BACT|nr:RagB/SusD family nutrient uptake outer membrane protein [Chitinophaga hostae]MBS0028025.1 RagB/SusD family nutrient uptake outer membrane protein [Chitinophaga hostae]